jgi:transcriptional regulator with XRE-family HTH domain
MRSKGKALVEIDHDSISAEIGARIREVREERAISQQDLGKMLGMSFQQIQKYERGSNSISISRLFQISIALDITIEHLISGVVPTKEKQILIEESDVLPVDECTDLRFDRKNFLKIKNIPSWPRGMNDRIASAYTGMKLGKFRTQVIRGLAPAPIDLGGGSEVWLRDHLDTWLDTMFSICSSK